MENVILSDFLESEQFDAFRAEKKTALAFCASGQYHTAVVINCIDDVFRLNDYMSKNPQYYVSCKYRDTSETNKWIMVVSCTDEKDEFLLRLHCRTRPFDETELTALRG